MGPWMGSVFQLKANKYTQKKYPDSVPTKFVAGKANSGSGSVP